MKSAFRLFNFIHTILASFVAFKNIKYQIKPKAFKKIKPRHINYMGQAH